jgi:hypothetical protein
MIFIKFIIRSVEQLFSRLELVPFLSFPRIGRIAAADARPKRTSEFHDADLADDDGMGMRTKRRI